MFTVNHEGFNKLERNYIFNFDAGRGHAYALSNLNRPNEVTKRLFLENDYTNISLIESESVEKLVEKVKSQHFDDESFEKLLNETKVNKFLIDGYRGRAIPLNGYAKKLVKGTNIKCTIFDEKQIEKLKMGCLIGVALSSGLILCCCEFFL